MARVARTRLRGGVVVWTRGGVPFAKVRYLWSRLLLAILALAPIAQYWWVYIFQFQRHGEVGGWLTRASWLLDHQSQMALAVLAGVAVASGFTARE